MESTAQFVQVHACPGGEGYVLSVGLTSVWVSVRTAQEIVSSLCEMLSARERAEMEAWQRTRLLPEN